MLAQMPSGAMMLWKMKTMMNEAASAESNRSVVVTLLLHVAAFIVVAVSSMYISNFSHASLLRL